ncbi:transmembrane and coiled-coil domain-containing protein 4 [Poeciliopsis prolifica]|uniref:transmembrane and coiled-coil domain-containing protein 4 n=1 Tax=Poeciliopsis prolifica TaxID=188132 RepID=UPI0024137882|nr:transmembrane and coiled-coil domain-containing protein 4 [Poeciliopsis prolifica]XP_054904417.1 transmembrane and coiled-coil domain-containing protein 4 [Poeciliopsis prolifica]XP_054904418.1 transmembrane and coiled-coil domain-containing protein 4 [Poeciliopsis prolifica]XP_054904419.1 transmembrane and coiled-coil domain-containing protein 4 [Poeciliopsis prolifica]
MEEKQSNANFPPDPGGAAAAATTDHELEKMTSRQLTEQSRFAFAALCAVSLGQLFSASENSAFREQYLQDLVQWLGLDQSVMPVMGAFLSGLGYEGTDTFLSILQADLLVAAGATPIIQDLVSLSVKDGQYDARARVLIRHVSCLLRVSPQQLEELEETLGEMLREAGEESEEESCRRRRRERGRKLRRYLLIGLATVAGGTMIGVTGGLAAPLLAAGAGSVLGAGGAAALGSAAGIAIMASLFGAAGAGLTGYKMNKCIGAIEEFEFRPMSSGKHLHLTIAVTGWLSSGKYSSFQAPWSSLGECGEQYCLVWESRFLRDLGSAMTSLLDGLVSMVAQEALKYTVLSGIMTALTLPASLLAAASVIDNPWCVSLNRSAEVGKHLAQVLRSRQQGKRPVSLIGFSLGARVIYYCLQELANDEGSEGVVEDVVLLGAPVDGSEKSWERLVRVVAGRIVNGYCRGDWLLGFLYRSSAAQLSVAGLHPINIQDRRIINVDLSSVVKGHLDYMRQMDTILVAVGVPTREVAGASFVLPQSVRAAQKTVDNLDRAKEQHRVSKTQNPAKKDKTLSQENADWRYETEDMADGWDIPDITDLLDSLNETEPNDGVSVLNNVSPNDATSSNFIA